MTRTKLKIVSVLLVLLCLVGALGRWDRRRQLTEAPLVRTVAKAVPAIPGVQRQSGTAAMGSTMPVQPRQGPQPGVARRVKPAVAAGGPEISEQAWKQINALEEAKDHRTAAQQKIDSQLLYADAMRRGVPVAAGTPTQRVELDWDKEGRVLVDIQADVSGDLLRLIGSMGGSVVNSFVEYHAIRAAVPLEAVEKLAGDGRVKFIAPAVRGQGAAVDSEGDYTHAAKAARATFGATGAGVKVGVLSDSVDHLTGSQIDGLVTVISGQGGSGEGEGTAMLEIVHDLAPGAQLYFATANGGTANFANNIHQLQVAGCNVIVDDYEYFNESPFQDATVAQAANTATAAGVLYFSAAMNSGNA